MFRIFYDDICVGHSALEEGDPPMGCALGVFHPSPDYADFKARVTPEKDKEPELKRWIGLSVSTENGTEIDCVDVVLMEFDFGDAIDLLVDVLGIAYPLYEELFPGRLAAYEASFSQN